MGHFLVFPKSSIKIPNGYNTLGNNPQGSFCKVYPSTLNFGQMTSFGQWDAGLKWISEWAQGTCLLEVLPLKMRLFSSCWSKNDKKHDWLEFNHNMRMPVHTVCYVVAFTFDMVCHILTQGDFMTDRVANISRELWAFLRCAILFLIMKTARSDSLEGMSPAPSGASSIMGTDISHQILVSCIPTTSLQEYSRSVQL